MHGRLYDRACLLGGDGDATHLSPVAMDMRCLPNGTVHSPIWFIPLQSSCFIYVPAVDDRFHPPPLRIKGKYTHKLFLRVGSILGLSTMTECHFNLSLQKLGFADSMFRLLAHYAFYFFQSC